MRTTRGALALFFIDTLNSAISDRFRGVIAKYHVQYLAPKLECLVGLHPGQFNDPGSCVAVPNQIIWPGDLPNFSP